MVSLTQLSPLLIMQWHLHFIIVSAETSGRECHRQGRGKRFFM